MSNFTVTRATNWYTIFHDNFYRYLTTIADGTRAKKHAFLQFQAVVGSVRGYTIKGKISNATVRFLHSRVYRQCPDGILKYCSKHYRRLS